MKTELILYIAMSLDGFIAREDGSVDWLMEYDDDYGYADFIESIEAVIMGRKTYEQIKTLSNNYPYKDKNTYIVTRNLSLDCPFDHKIISDDIENEIIRIKEKSKKNIWLVGGERLVNYCLDHCLIDRVILFIVPILINSGIRLLKNLKPTNLKLENIKKYDNSMLMLDYKIK